MAPDFFNGFVTLPLLTDDFEQGLPWISLTKKAKSHITEIQRMMQQWNFQAEPIVQAQAKKMIERMIFMQSLDETLKTAPKDLDYRIVFRGYPWTMRTK